MTKNNENDPIRQIVGPDGKLVPLPPGKDPIQYTSELFAAERHKQAVERINNETKQREKNTNIITPPPPLSVSLPVSPIITPPPPPIPVKPPSLFQMVRGFAKELTKYVSEGAPNVTPEVYLDRLAACDSCPHLKKDSMRCGLCGCLIEHKAKWQTTTCPDSPTRWEDSKNCNCNDQKQESNSPETGN